MVAGDTEHAGGRRGLGAPQDFRADAPDSGTEPLWEETEMLREPRTFILTGQLDGPAGDDNFF